MLPRAPIVVDQAFSLSSFVRAASAQLAREDSSAQSRADVQPGINPAFPLVAIVAHLELDGKDYTRTIECLRCFT